MQTTGADPNYDCAGMPGPEIVVTREGHFQTQTHQLSTGNHFCTFSTQGDRSTPYGLQTGAATNYELGLTELPATRPISAYRLGWWASIKGAIAQNYLQSNFGNQVKNFHISPSGRSKRLLDLPVIYRFYDGPVRQVRPGLFVRTMQALTTFS